MTQPTTFDRATPRRSRASRGLSSSGSAMTAGSAVSASAIRGLSAGRTPRNIGRTRPGRCRQRLKWPHHGSRHPSTQPLFVTMSTAAGLAGCARQHMSREVRANRVPGVWIDGQWIVLRSAAQAMELQKLGRPRIHPLPRILETPANQRKPRQADSKQKRRRKPQQG